MTGDTPLLQHADVLADPLADVTKAFKKVSGKRTKTDQDHEEMARMEFLAGLYFEDDKVVIPNRNIMKNLVEGARVTKMGPKVERGVTISGAYFPLVYDGPKTPEALYADKNFVSRMTVKVGTARTIRCRPIFRKWAVTATALIDPAIISVEELQDIATNAGALIGLGDYRRGGGFGRFSARVTPV
ncbi:hypothetical protein [uncultured Nocardioides sp.]|uniref:hypothetical protein n=1 Tax=uncultured Nocardioides sp. TaxID=198441 RepID=UPI00260AC7A0|nr:hypothetical protein [uncultured Nocardioides sp.]